MKSKIFFLFSVAFLSCLLTTNANAQTSLSDLKSEHSKTLKSWLATQKNWRLALEKDYDRERLNDFKTAEKSMPFYSAGDFNGDKKEDFAVIITKGGKFAVAVFNAPFNSEKASFYSTALEKDDILYFPKDAKSLVVGPYESDAGFALIPKGKTYRAEYFTD